MVVVLCDRMTWSLGPQHGKQRRKWRESMATSSIDIEIDIFGLKNNPNDGKVLLLTRSWC